MIPFPKMHIAQSVLNRIANQLEERGPLGESNKPPAPVEMQEPPIAPDPLAMGMAIDDKLGAPTAPIGVAPEDEADANNGMLEASALGGSPFDGALIGAGG